MRSGACVCGQVVFDLSGRDVGSELTCCWCGKKYWFLGDDKIGPVIPGQAPPKPPPAPPTALKAKALGARSMARQSRAPHGPPGGLMPMIGFIVGSNVLAIVAVSFLLEKSTKDDTRHFIWDESIIVQPRAIWPEIVALLLGMVVGFGAWALFAYRVHKRELAERAAGAKGAK